jgi:VIT1/CCC1 family predicted Fe2+/Mn2+ transporter
MSWMKRLDQARRGYEEQDPSLSSAAHDPANITRAVREGPEEHGGLGSAYLGEIVYGGLDGIITTFAVVSGVAGAELGTGVILILGLANLFADGFSMATGSYLSTKSEQEFYEKERARESWEVDHYPEGERVELIELYRASGYKDQEAEQLVDIITRDKEHWVDAMMVDELGLLRDERNPLLNAMATLISFILFGSTPLLIYLLGLLITVQPAIRFPVSLTLSASALLGLGVAKVRVTHQHPLRSGIEMLLVGGLAAGVAYIVGALLKGIGG